MLNSHPKFWVALRQGDGMAAFSWRRHLLTTHIGEAAGLDSSALGLEAYL